MHACKQIIIIISNLLSNMESLATTKWSNTYVANTQNTKKPWNIEPF